MLIQNRKEKEDRILEAICDRERWTLKEISRATTIGYDEVRRIISEANLLPELRKHRQKSEYQKLAEAYRRGMLVSEVSNITGILEYRIVKIYLPKLREETAKEIELLVDTLQKIILKRALNEDVPFYYAYLYYLKKRPSGLEFEEVYRRTRDIYAGYNIFDLSEKWGITAQGASRFIRSVEMHAMFKSKRRSLIKV